jgi:hypothetical protein
MVLRSFHPRVVQLPLLSTVSFSHQTGQAQAVRGRGIAPKSPERAVDEPPIKRECAEGDRQMMAEVPPKPAPDQAGVRWTHSFLTGLIRGSDAVNGDGDVSERHHIRAISDPLVYAAYVS